MEEVMKMLRAIINGQSSLKQELSDEIKKVDEKMTEGFDEVNRRFGKVEKRLDKIGLSVANLEDDTPTREEFDELEGRVTKVESSQFASV